MDSFHCFGQILFIHLCWHIAVNTFIASSSTSFNSSMGIPSDPGDFPLDRAFKAFLTVAQLVECRTRNRESPGSNPRCYRFEVWAFSFTSRRLSRLSCINEYLAIDSGGNVSE